MISEGDTLSINRLFRCNISWVSAKKPNVFVSGKDNLVKHQGSAVTLIV